MENLSYGNSYMALEELFELRPCLKDEYDRLVNSHAIQCESPVIITNPELRSILTSDDSDFLYMNGFHVCLTPARKAMYACDYKPSYFSAYNRNVTASDVAKYFVHMKDDTLEPVYLSVMCRKCTLCRSKSANDWAFRCAAESKYSVTEPLFITLTYNPASVPFDGVHKRDIQLFMKRLRRSLDKKGLADKEHPLRYIACGEYGRKHGRPHYHMILWNMPRKAHLKTIYGVSSYIARVWSSYDPVTAEVDPLGFVYVKPLTVGGVDYVLKYMRKAPRVPAGMNPCFFLSSRGNGGGIGRQYADEMCAYYRSHPEQVVIGVTDPYTGRTITTSLPKYFKDVFSPSPSKYITKELRQDYVDFINYSCRFATLIKVCDYRIPLDNVEKCLDFPPELISNIRNDVYRQNMYFYQQRAFTVSHYYSYIINYRPFSYWKFAARQYVTMFDTKDYEAVLREFFVISSRLWKITDELFENREVLQKYAYDAIKEVRQQVYNALYANKVMTQEKIAALRSKILEDINRKEHKEVF